METGPAPTVSSPVGCLSSNRDLPVTPLPPPALPQVCRSGKRSGATGSATLRAVLWWRLKSASCERQLRPLLLSWEGRCVWGGPDASQHPPPVVRAACCRSACLLTQTSLAVSVVSLFCPHTPAAGPHMRSSSSEVFISWCHGDMTGNGLTHLQRRPPMVSRGREGPRLLHTPVKTDTHVTDPPVWDTTRTGDSCQKSVDVCVNVCLSSWFLRLL